MTMFKVALLQMLAHGSNQQANMKKGIEYCREAAALGEIGWLIQLWLLMMALILSPVIITFFLRSPDHEIVA